MIIVGINRYQEKEMEIPQVLKVDPEFEKRQVVELKKLKANRDRKKLKEALENVRQAAVGDVGEIADVFRQLWGEYRETL